MKRLVLPIFILIATGISAQGFSEAIKVISSDRAEYDYFANSISISGNYAIAGAASEDEDTLGLNTINSAGSAYIFERDGAGSWIQVQKIVASDRSAIDLFGSSVAISGNYAVIGAYAEDDDLTGNNSLSDAGSAYIFERNGAGVWIEKQKVVPSDRRALDYFGKTVAISGDNIIIGAHKNDYDAIGGGNSLNDAGAAYIFERNGAGIWSEKQKIISSDRQAEDSFGFSVDIDGTYAVVGAFTEDENATGGSTMNYAGSAYVYERDGAGNWNQVKKIVPSDRSVYDWFGYAVSISGNKIVVGAPQEDDDVNGTNTLSDPGSIYIFKRIGVGNWIQSQKLVASDRGHSDALGFVVSISGDNVVSGAYLEDEDTTGNNNIGNAGSAYIFQFDGITWSELQKITASDRGVSNYFGSAVAVSNDYFFIGAHRDDKDLTGGNILVYAGSGYFFEPCSTIDKSVTNTSPTLIANATNATYQWLDCNNANAIITNETDQTYTVTANGSYAVELNRNGCIDTSACVLITNVGIKENMSADIVFIAPNPTNSKLTIHTKTEQLNITVVDITGKKVEIFRLGNNTIDVSNLVDGIYFIQIEEMEKRNVLKFVKN